jgi:hypothetical protein
MFRQFFVLVCFVTGFSMPCNATNYYVSAMATGSGNGSLNDPWMLQQALNSPAAITNPKDTIWIWIRGGIYTNKFDSQSSFSCKTNGNPGAPIIFRNYNNERVTIDGQLTYTMAFVLGSCSFTWIWGLEFTNSSTADRDHPNYDRPGDIYCTAENIKFINLVIHDMGSGLDLWKTAKNTESYGCIIYNIGNNLNNNGNWEGHGHGMYLQNDTIGTKVIHNNIVFNTFAYGIKIWQTTTTAAIGNFDIQRNIVFNGGATSENLGGVGNNSRTHNFFVVANGVNNPITNTVIKHNCTYSGTNTPRPPVNAFGLNYGVKNMVLDSNYLTCQTRLGFNNTPIFDASVKGNKIIAGIPAEYGIYLWGFLQFDFPENDYYPSLPQNGLEYFILPNKYEPNRSHIVIYNWDGSSTIQVNAAEAGLKTGDKYALVNVMDYYNDIDRGTVLPGDMINIPMSGHTYAAVTGSAKPSVSQFPKFGVFVISKVGNSSTTGIIENSINDNVSIVPNPVDNELKIHGINAHENDRVQIMNLEGRIIYDNSSFKGELINTAQFNNGIYLLKYSGNKNILIKKIIVRHL